MAKRGAYGWDQEPVYTIYTVQNGYTLSARTVPRSRIRLALLAGVASMFIGGTTFHVALDNAGAHVVSQLSAARSTASELRTALAQKAANVVDLENRLSQATSEIEQKTALLAQADASRTALIAQLAAGQEERDRLATEATAARSEMDISIAVLRHAMDEQIVTHQAALQAQQGAHLAALAAREDRCRADTDTALQAAALSASAEVAALRQQGELERLRAGQLEARLDAEKRYSADLMRWARGVSLAHERSANTLAEMQAQTQRFAEESLKALSGAGTTNPAAGARLAATCADLDRVLDTVRGTPLAPPVSNNQLIGTANTAAARRGTAPLTLAVESGAPVTATASGRVSFAGRSGAEGLTVEIDHGRGIVTRYRSLSSIEVRQGDTIPSGAIIGHVGDSGALGRLGYEILVDGQRVDPTEAMERGEDLRRVIERQRASIGQGAAIERASTSVAPPRVPDPLPLPPPHRAPQHPR